jgi:hypothetical protein
MKVRHLALIQFLTQQSTMVEILPVLPHANVEAVRRQLAHGHTPHVALALPENWFELDNIARLRLLQRQAQIQRRHLALITRQESTRKLANSLGIPVYMEAADAQRRRWQMYPELPLVNPRKPAEGLPEAPPWRRSEIVARSARPSHHQTRQRRIRAEEAARRPLPYWLRFFGYLAMAGIVAVVLNFFLFNVLPAATVALVPGRASMTVSVPLTADGTLETIDTETNSLPARFIETNIEATGSIATTGSQQKASDRAVGQVDFNNLGSASVNIPAGTIVSTSTGTPVNFRTTAPATLEGGVGARVTVPIEAEQPGLEGNVRANTINTVNGALRFRVRVTNLGGTGGGGAQLVRVVTQADRDKLLEQVQADAEARAYEQLQQELLPGEWLPPESVQTIVTSSVFDKFNDDEGDTLTLSLRVLAQGTTLDQEQTNEAMLAALRASVPSGGRLVANSVATRREPGAVALGRTVQFTMTAVAEYVVPIDPSEVTSAIAGLTPEAAITTLTTQWPLARPPEIYRDPEWLDTLPTFPSRIQVRIDYGDNVATQ